MLILDIKTLGFTAILLCFVVFAGLLRFAYDNRRFFSIRFFGYGNLFLLGGLVLVSFRNVASPLFTLPGSNALIALAFIFFSMGAASFLRVYFHAQWIHWTLLVAMTGLSAYFSLVNINPYINIFLLNSFILGETVYGGTLFIKAGRQSFSAQRNGLAFSYFLFSLYALFRIISTVLEISYGDLVDDELVYSIFFIVLILFIISTAFQLIWNASSILNDDLEMRARLDPLTKAMNRRAFLDELNREIARSKRQSLTFSLIMADLDHFKQINDRNGHLAGDSVLMAFASLIQENLRINDVLSRYGEEEFMILLPNTEKKNAVETAERIRKIVEINHHPFNGQDIQFTVSFGVTSFDMDAQNKEELLENVDIALYEAKSKGRNCVESK